MPESAPTASDALAEATDALMRGSFAEARGLFEASLALEETPEALEGLGVAAAWLDDPETAADARERAYRAFRKRGAGPEAARAAMTLGMMHIGFLGAPDVARGWLRRARHILEDVDPTPIHGWVSIGEGFIALIYDKDPDAGLALSRDAVRVGRSVNDTHVEMMATGQAGLCLVIAGKVREGMPLLDEAVAAALGGELSDPSVITNTCCYMITACERVRDYARAAQWARRAIDYCKDWADRSTFSFCRSAGSAVFIWEGKWREAEHELASALAEIGDSKPAIRTMATTRLADLRRRQGRFDEADALLDQLDAEALRGAFGPDVLLARAFVALDRGDLRGASDVAERYLRRVPPGVPLERLDALSALALARVRAADLEGARAPLVELERIAETLETEAVRGTAALARGVDAKRAGDLEEARRALEDAVDLYESSRGIQEAARARLELADVLAQLDRRDAAEHEARSALRTLSDLGATADAASAQETLGRLGARPARRATDGVTLTERESEILREIAKGRSNQEIAETLFLSVRTVERHISNIYAKVGAHGKAARAAAAAYAHTHGLT